VLIIGREKRYQVYDLQIEKPAPLIPRRFIGEVDERILADGAVRTPLDGPTRRAIPDLVSAGRDDAGDLPAARLPEPAHEKRLAALVAQEAPHVTVTMSHESRRPSASTSEPRRPCERLRHDGDPRVPGASPRDGRARLPRPPLRDAVLRRRRDAERCMRYPVRMIEVGAAAAP